MKTAYIAKANIPSTSANSIHVMKISEAFSTLCEDFWLIIPESQKENRDIKKIFSTYGVSPFNVAEVKMATSGIGSRYLFPLKCLWKARNADKIVTRDPLVAFVSVLFHKQTVLDLHGDLRHLCGRAYRIILWKRFRDSKYLHLVMITRGLASYYHEKYQVRMDKMTVLPDGYTSQSFEKIIPKKLLQSEIMQIGYCGGFIVGKGLGLIQKLTLQDNQNEYNLYGGSKENAQKEVQGYFGDNTRFGGYVANVMIPEILNDQDILLLPNQRQQICKNEDIGKVTSPLKMFEYMASGKVIIASDLPVLREILDESNCYFADADDVESWKKSIDHISQNREEAVCKAQKAQQDVKQYTWKIRAKRILNLLEGNS